MGKKEKESPSRKAVCRNRRARYNYHIEDTMEAGLVLVGTEVKSLRLGRADLADSYATFQEGELFLVGSHIAEYDKASHFNHDPRRSRKLLLHGRAIRRLGVKIRERGYTLVPLEIYFKEGWAKVLLGLAKGRKQYDNRETIRRKEERREMREAARDRRRG
ncbi:MAG: SsrA-binding protein SmpB [Deltaproteobacteria bacterium]|nr:SsrA-binding protein SmpB [Deltaproteobacteria bacterium]